MHAPTQFQSDCSDHSQSPRPLQGCQAAGKMDWTSDFANLFKQGRACGGFLEGVGSCSPGWERHPVSSSQRWCCWGTVVFAHPCAQKRWHWRCSWRHCPCHYQDEHLFSFIAKGAFHDSIQEACAFSTPSPLDESVGFTGGKSSQGSTGGTQCLVGKCGGCCFKD